MAGIIICLQFLVYAKENDFLGITEPQKYVHVQTHLHSHTTCSIDPKIHFSKTLDMLVHNIIFHIFTAMILWSFFLKTFIFYLKIWI